MHRGVAHKVLPLSLASQGRLGPAFPHCSEESPAKLWRARHGRGRRHGMGDEVAMAVRVRHDRLAPLVRSGGTRHPPRSSSVLRSYSSTSSDPFSKVVCTDFLFPDTKEVLLPPWRNIPVAREKRAPLVAWPGRPIRERCLRLSPGTPGFTGIFFSDSEGTEGGGGVHGVMCNDYSWLMRVQRREGAETHGNKDKQSTDVTKNGNRARSRPGAGRSPPPLRFP